VRSTADRVRLDLRTAAQGEIYSWVGESRFRNRSLFSIVNDGSLSTGYFNGFLDLVFRSDHTNLFYSGEVSEGGRKLMEYRYRKPLEGSHYDFFTPRASGNGVAAPTGAGPLPSERQLSSAIRGLSVTGRAGEGTNNRSPSGELVRCERRNDKLNGNSDRNHHHRLLINMRNTEKRRERGAKIAVGHP
jgi:hypothetical protein